MGNCQTSFAKTYIGEGEYVEILFQLLGLVGKKYDFKQTEKNEAESIAIDNFANYVDRADQLIQDKETCRGY